LKEAQLIALYDQLWDNALLHVKSKGFDHDPLIDSPSDNRFGITLLIRPSQEVNDAVQHFLSRVKAIEPAHYFYPNPDIHVTVMPIISCYDGFELRQISPEAYISILKGCLVGLSPFSIEFKGVTVSPSCILIKGFPMDDTLKVIRNRLRLAFKDSPLKQSLDKRYPLQTAHSTVIRFKQPVRNQEAVLEQLDQFRDFYFGRFEVKELELVFNDWYQRKDKVQRLCTFRLNKR
jgi:2'-5' RNA ligase